MPKIAKTTLKVLAMSNELSNREVADALDLDIDVVKNVRRNHKVVHKKTPKDRGYKDKILNMPYTTTPALIAFSVGCTENYVRSVLRKAKMKNS